MRRTRSFSSTFVIRGRSYVPSRTTFCASCAWRHIENSCTAMSSDTDLFTSVLHGKNTLSQKRAADGIVRTVQLRSAGEHRFARCIARMDRESGDTMASVRHVGRCERKPGGCWAG